MPVLSLNSAIFDAMEDVFNLPEVRLDHEAALDGLIEGYPTNDPVLLQLSSSLIRFSQDVEFWNGSDWQAATYEIRLSGAGIKPVRTLDALMNAINNGLALGTLTKLEIVTAGTTILALTMDAAGYHLTSGGQSVTLEGTLPLSFLQFSEMAGLFDQVMNIDFLTRAERLALFDDLGSYGISGLIMADGGTELIALRIAAAEASIMINGLTMTLTGTFPANFGEDLALVWEVYRQFGRTGQIDFATLSGLAVDAITFTDAAGTVLGSMADPTADTALSAVMGGKTYDGLHMGDEGDNYWVQGDQTESVVIAGLTGQDSLIGGAKGDYLLGGGGSDRLVGKAGADVLDGGAGRDVLTGGFGADVFDFALGDGSDTLTDFRARTDVIRILAATRKSDLTFTDLGDDVMIDFQNIHILVQDISLRAISLGVNFEF